jgi:hypothetical protein
MAINELKSPVNIPTRRKFVWGLGIVSALAALNRLSGFPVFRKKKPGLNQTENKNKTVRMLTQDGRLVEVDITRINGNKKKVSNTELQHWIKNRS